MFTRVLTVIWVLAGMGALVPAIGHAASPETDGPLLHLFGNISVASDGMAKGASETGGDAQAVATANLGYGPFSAGYLIKNVSTPQGGDAQHKIYAGIEGKYSDIDLTGQLWFTRVSGTPSGTDADFAEWVFSASKVFGGSQVSVTAVHSPDSYGTTRGDTWLEAALAHNVTDKLSVSGTVGNHMLSPDADFKAWNFGAAYKITSKASVDLRYYDTNAHDLGKNFEPRLVVSLSKAF